MDRNQKIEKIANLHGRVSRISNLIVDAKHLDSNYIREECDGVLSETGELEILKLVPKSGTGPYFRARWDQVPERVDFDMENASNSAIRNFNKHARGYGGHHTDRTTDPNTRVFDVKIELPNRVIFEGQVSFSVTYEVKETMRAEAKLIIDDQLIHIIRAPQNLGK